MGGRDKSGCLAAREPVVEPDHASKGGTKHVRGHGLYPNVKLKPVQELKQEDVNGPFVFGNELLKEAEEAIWGFKGGRSGLVQEPHNDPELNSGHP